MVKNHRAIHQWNRWLKEPVGYRLTQLEQHFLSTLLANYSGKYMVLIGVPEQGFLFKNNLYPYPILISPLINKNKMIHFMEAEFNKLPITTGSIDLVLLPHTLEYVDNPQQLLTECCRIIKPEGYIIIFGFNPYSLYGLAKYFMKKKEMPWTNHFISTNDVIKWLKLVDFELIKKTHLLYRSLWGSDKVYQSLTFLEWLGKNFWSPFGGVYMLMAQAKVIPLTPIKLHWRQELSGTQIIFPGPSTRNL